MKASLELLGGAFSDLGGQFPPLGWGSFLMPKTIHMTDTL